MKKRLFLFSCFALIFAFLLLNTLSAITEESTAKETELPPGIADLLSGKDTDLQSALTNLEEPDFPLALTVCEVLQHKALHHDIQISPREAEAFKASLQKRFESSQAISFKETSTCIQKIPAFGIVVEGKHLTVPEHYLAPVKFAITSISPTGEAGTLLPDIRVSFTGGKAPISAKISLDGKGISAKAVKDSFLYRPPLNPESIVMIGTHTIDCFLTDSTGKTASQSWEFTVGMKTAGDVNSPSDSRVVGSFAVPLNEIALTSRSEAKVIVIVRETSDGKRFLEYQIFSSIGSGRSTIIS